MQRLPTKIWSIFTAFSPLPVLTNVRVGDFVVVVGLGAIGQIAIQLAKRAGASVVIGVDPIAHRCDIARRHGADFCLNPIGTDVGKEIKTLTGKQGADVIIETSGYADALQSFDVEFR